MNDRVEAAVWDEAARVGRDAVGQWAVAAGRRAPEVADWGACTGCRAEYAAARVETFRTMPRNGYPIDDNLQLVRYGFSHPVVWGDMGLEHLVSVFLPWATARSVPRHPVATKWRVKGPLIRVEGSFEAYVVPQGTPSVVSAEGLMANCALVYTGRGKKAYWVPAVGAPEVRRRMALGGWSRHELVLAPPAGSLGGDDLRRFFEALDRTGAGTVA